MNRGRTTLVVATALHLAILAGFARRESPRATALVPPVLIDAVAIETDVAELPAMSDSPAVAVAVPERVARVERASPAAPAAIASGEPSTEVVAVERATDWVVHPTGNIDLAVPKSAFAKGGVFEPPPAQHAPIPVVPPPLSKSGGLVEGLDARDMHLGLGRGGPILSAVDAAAHDPAAPVLGKALFAISVLDNGSIKVDTLNASSERAAWEKLAPIIAQGLADKNVRVPNAAKGIRVTVSVDAREQFASGAPPVPPEKQGFKAGGSIGKITEKKDQIEITPPHVSLGYQGKKCGASIVILPGSASLGAGCEVGVPVRVVETHDVREERL